MADPVPFGFNSDYLNYLREKFFKMEPNLRPGTDWESSVGVSGNPSALPERYMSAGRPQAPQFLQNLGSVASKIATAFDPAQSIPYMLGSLPGPQKFAAAHPQLADIISTITSGAIGGAGGNEAGMNSLPISTLKALAQRDTERALAPPDIHDVINARNELYHATGSPIEILHQGKINPGSGDQFQGVATSRTPVIPEKTRQTRFAIDPTEIPPSKPTADIGYGKTIRNIGNYNAVFDAMTPKEFEQVKQETAKIYNNFNTDKESPKHYGMADKSLMTDSPTFQKVNARISSGGPQNPSFEFETRTKGQPISTSAIKEAIISTQEPHNIYDKNPMQVYSDIIQSKNPVPAKIIARELLPLYKAIKTRELSKQVVGQ